MSEEKPDVNKELASDVGRQLLENALDRARGKSADVTWGRPERDFYIANLAPGYDDDGEPTDDGPFSESSPSMVGLRCQPADKTGSYTMTLSFDIFYRAFPPLVELEEKFNEITPEAVGQNYYVKVPVSTSKEIDLSTGPATIEAELEPAVQEALDQAVQTAEAQTDPFPDGGIKSHTDTDAREELRPGEYEQLQTLAADQSPVEQQWDVGCSVDVEMSGREQPELTISLTNESTEIRNSCCPYLFNQEIQIRGRFHRYRFRAVPEDFRYNRDIWAKGLNSSTSSSLKQSNEAISHGTLETAQVPSHQTFRFDHRTYEQTDGVGSTAAPSSFEALSSDEVIAQLETIQSDMRDYRDEIRSNDGRRGGLTKDLTADEEDEFDKSIRQFDQEIDRFGHGIAVLKEHSAALRAFKLMNQTFAEQETGFDNWYVFQLVFIVSNLPSIVDRMENISVEATRQDEAEILWFPTGGGKTEAYLGLVLYNLFFDRIRGKAQGVTAWIRFPLTLLGEQQMGRFLEKLVAANKIRRDEDLPGEEFTLGYFVGGNTTPNQIMGSDAGYGNNLYDEFQTNQELLEDKCRVVEDCPNCGSQVDVEFNADYSWVQHKCPNRSCRVATLPLYVTDYEIYRYVPSILLGTLDKIAITGTNPRFANLIGNLTTKCPIHGYGYSGKCSEENTIGCDAKLEEIEPSFHDPIPTLHLVDEVHLLNEELGVFASHYETMYLQLCEEFEDVSPKVVTSTATISGREGVTNAPAYERLMQGLFCRGANRFPEEGPTFTESFYGEVKQDDPDKRLRTFYGITPNNKTHIYAVLDLVKQYLTSIRRARDNPSSILSPDIGNDDLKRVLYLYELSIIYFLRKTEKDRFTRSMKSQIQRELRDEGVLKQEDSIWVDELTGDSESGNLLDKYDHEQGSKPPFEDRTDLIAATSFISHGIDFERFNSMFFFGFPRRTFQYIQSSSRVGREYPGFVVNMFLPYDNRDRHRYKYFEKTHEYLERTVEETAVARWSRFSLNKTFPGLFRSILLQYYRPLMHREHDVNVQSSRQLEKVLTHEGEYGEFTQDQFGRILEAAYGLGSNGPSGPASSQNMTELSDEQAYFQQEIHKRINRYWQYWLDHLNEEYYTTFSEDPMRSLRDIGESIEIRVGTDEQPLFNALTPEEN